MTSRRIGEILMQDGIITERQLNEALKVQNVQGGLLGIILVEMGYLKPKALAGLIDTQR